MNRKVEENMSNPYKRGGAIWPWQREEAAWCFVSNEKSKRFNRGHRVEDILRCKLSHKESHLV